MIKIEVSNTTNGMRCLTNSAGNGRKIAVPPRSDDGMNAKVEVSAEQFADCRTELKKLVNRGTLMLFASDGGNTQRIDFEAAADWFARQATAQAPQIPPQAPPPQPEIPPAPWARTEA